MNISDDGSLQCPNCFSICLHHDEIQIFHRDKEDSNSGLKLTVTKKQQTTLASDMKGNPSQRRNGVRIKFSCENCHIKSALLIHQHKGTTFLTWEK